MEKKLFLETFIDKIFKRNKVRANVPVISVGNISFGGTGKTPFVIYICNFLKELGYKPAVIGQGYKRKSKEDVVVANGEEILVDASLGGDEMALIAQRTGVPVFAGKLKSNIVAKMNNNDVEINYLYDFDCIVIDDGFQHKKLHRDLDIVLVDKKSISKISLKREGIKALKRADIIVCSNGLIKEELLNNCDFQLKNIITAKKNNSIPYNLLNKTKCELIEEKNIALVGIANSKRFLDTFKPDIISTLKYSDHHYYTLKDVEKIIKKCIKNDCSSIITTEKDATKLISYIEIFNKKNIKIIVFPIEMELAKEDKSVLKNMLNNLVVMQKSMIM